MGGGGGLQAGGDSAPHAAQKEAPYTWAELADGPPRCKPAWLAAAARGRTVRLMDARTRTTNTPAGARLRSGRQHAACTFQRGLTMVELVMTLVVISAMVIAFNTVPRGQGAAEDLAAQGRIDAVAGAIHNAWRPGVLLSELTIADLAAHTSAPMTGGTPVASDRERVSVAFGQGEQEGQYGLAALGREGACWYLRGRLGTTGVAGVELQNTWHSYRDFTQDGSQGLADDEAASAECSGEEALATDGGGPSWQRFAFQP